MLVIVYVVCCWCNTNVRKDSALHTLSPPTEEFWTVRALTGGSS